MSDVRDTQRSLVYDAEHLVHRLLDRAADFPVIDVAGSRLTLPVERRFANLESVQHYLDRVLALPAVAQRWSRAKVPVSARERRGGSRAHYERADAVIAVPGATAGSQWALRELVLLHELAHHLADDSEPAHGGAFVERMVELADLVMGSEAAFLLRVTFLENGVRVG